MEHWKPEFLLRRVGSHIASEPHIRIHIHNVTAPVSPSPYYFTYHGELLMLVMRGTCIVKTEKVEQMVNAGDQILLVNGEKFTMIPIDDEDTAVVQMIWTPGLNPCKVCWENDSRFFSNNVAD